MSKVLSVKNKENETTTLPNGEYVGDWGGSVITIIHENETYNLDTNVGVRGFGIQVKVIINDDEMTFEEI